MIDPPRQSESDVNHSPRRRAWAAASLSDANRHLVDRDAQAFLHQSVSSPVLAAIRRAEGIWIEDVDGRRYMDFHGNNVHNIGYGHPRLKAAIARQMDELPFTPRRFTSEPAVELAETLGRIAPGRLGKVLFTTGGSDALEVALKIARAATGRFKTVSFWDSFHGAGFGAASVGGEQLFRSGPIGPLLPGTEHVAPFHCYRCAYGHPDIDGGPDLERCRLACAAYLRFVLEREGDVAAVVAEPARAVPVLPPPGYWRAVRRGCDATRRAADLRRDPDRARPHRTYVRLRARRRRTRHRRVRQRRWAAASCRSLPCLPAPSSTSAAHCAFGHYTHEKNPVTARAALTTIADHRGRGPGRATPSGRAVLRWSGMRRDAAAPSD